MVLAPGAGMSGGDANGGGRLPATLEVSAIAELRRAPEKLSLPNQLQRE